MIAKYLLPLVAFLGLCTVDASAQLRIEPASADAAAIATWDDAAFANPQPVCSQGEAKDGLLVLRKSYKVLVNRTAWDTPLTLGNKQFARGVYMDAPASVLVRLPRSAEELTAQIGIDNNRDTHGY